MNNLTHELQIQYTNELGLNVSVLKKIYEGGLEVNSIQVGDICITEETINGRILSGRYEN